APTAAISLSAIPAPAALADAPAALAVPSVTIAPITVDGAAVPAPVAPVAVSIPENEKPAVLDGAADDESEAGADHVVPLTGPKTESSAMTSDVNVVEPIATTPT